MNDFNKAQGGPQTKPIAIEPGYLHLYSLIEEDNLWMYANVAYNTSDIWGIDIGEEHITKSVKKKVNDAIDKLSEQ